MSWRAALLWWLAWSGAGVALIALPDTGPRIVAFSGAHGPGLLDTLGIVLLLVGTLGFWRYLWRARGSFSPIRPVWTFAAGLGAGLIVASVFADFSAWWALGAGLLLAVQVALFVRTVSRRG